MLQQVRIGNSVLVATMADVVHCYGGKGGTARQYSLQQPAPVQCLQLLAAHTSRPTKCLLVALANGGAAGCASASAPALACLCSCSASAGMHTLSHPSHTQLTHT